MREKLTSRSGTRTWINARTTISIPMAPFGTNFHLVHRVRHFRTNEAEEFLAKLVNETCADVQMGDGDRGGDRDIGEVQRSMTE